MFHKEKQVVSFVGITVKQYLDELKVSAIFDKLRLIYVGLPLSNLQTYIV